MSLGIIILRMQKGLNYADLFGPLHQQQRQQSIIDIDDITITADNSNNGNMNTKSSQIPKTNDDNEDGMNNKFSNVINLERRLSNAMQIIDSNQQQSPQQQQQRMTTKKNFEKMKSINNFYPVEFFSLFFFHFYIVIHT